MNWLIQSLDGMSDCLLRAFTEVEEIVGAALSPPPRDQLSPADRERIRQSLWRLRDDLGKLGNPDLISDLYWLVNDAFGGPDDLVITTRAWVDLVDTLVLETERDYGAKPGRGIYKKRQIKGAMLYLVARLDLKLPNVPDFVAPIVWDILLDGGIDFLAQFSNRYARWGDVPRQPGWRQRTKIGVQRVESAAGSLARGLGSLAWSLELWLTPVSPQLKVCVDRFLIANPDPVGTLVVLASWLVHNTGTLLSLVDLFAVALEEGRFILDADPERRKAYASEFVLDFIQDETGLSRQSTSFRLIEAFVNVGIEVTAMLFEKDVAATRLALTV